jgi:hypothetical protein
LHAGDYTFRLSGRKTDPGDWQCYNSAKLPTCRGVSRAAECLGVNINPGSLMSQLPLQ